MDIRPRLTLVAAVLLACALAACGDDDNPATPNDTTPPGVSAVTPVDDHNIDITFSEQVTKASAEDESNYAITPAPVPVSPKGGEAARGGITVAGATLKGDNKTVTVSTQNSMAGLNLQVTVHDVADMTGNKIGESGSSKPFTGSNTADATAPTVLDHAPKSNGTNIAVNPTIIVQFSESIASAASTIILGGGPGLAPTLKTGVTIPHSQTIDGAKLTLTLEAPLDYNTTYTVFAAGTDYAGNAGSNTSWSFTTQLNNDHTPPTLVSTVPANLAAGVDVNADLSLTFSEAMDQENFSVELVPDPGDGVATWSNGGKTVTFNPTAPLADDTQFTFTIFPNGVYDLAGNGIVGVHTVMFTTANTLAAGSIGGTVTGDPGTGANDPTGAQLIVADGNPFATSVNVFGSATVAGNNTYNVQYLPDLLYYVITVMDTNHDGDLNPEDGDAVGGFGVDIPGGDLDPDGIAVEGGAHVTGKNFTMYDPTTASGTVSYSGAVKPGEYAVYVGLFDTNGFSITDDPLAATDASGIDHAWSYNSAEGTLLGGPFVEGSYYIGAFMDINFNGTFEPDTDPAGFYGGLPAPTAVNMTNGADRTGIVIPISDPVPGLVVHGPASVVWPKAKPNAAFQRLVEMVRQGQQQASR